MQKKRYVLAFPSLQYLPFHILPHFTTVVILIFNSNISDFVSLFLESHTALINNNAYQIRPGP